MADEQTLIEARDLGKRYGNFEALKGLSFEVKRGEVVGFLGPNGAGKTTTMRILTGYLRPTRGSALVAGTDVATDPMLTRARIGYLPESAPLYEDMMVIDYLHFAANIREVEADAARTRIKELVERCGLSEVIGKDIRQLSKGYRQRVGLAQAMIHDPEVLILDEPTSGLDPNQIVEIRELIRDVGQDKTVILSTHILPEVQATCDRVLIISEGKLVADDTPDGLSERESGVIINVSVAARNGVPVEHAAVAKAFEGLAGIRKVKEAEGEGEGVHAFRLSAGSEADVRPDIFRTVVDHDWVLLDLHREQVSLEDTFRRLTRGEEEGGK